MFSAIVKCFSRLKDRDSREIKILLLGLDNAGKSTIINDLKGGEPFARRIIIRHISPDEWSVLCLEPKEPTIPTVGFSSAEFKLLNFKVTAYDVGGGPRIRGIWKDYYAEVFGMVYVVDASDHDRIADSRTVLREALSDSRLAGKPFIMFANKQDIDGSLSEQDIELQFELQQFAKKCESCYKVFQCTALLNGGQKVDSQLKKGLNWLLQTVKEDFASLKDRVQREVEVQKEAERKERAERRERVQRRREERERAEREKECAKNKENDESDDDDDVVFGNVLPRVKDVSKTRQNKSKTDCRVIEEEENYDEKVEEIQSSKLNNELNSNRTSEEPLAENSEKPSETGNQPEHKKKRKKKKKAKRNQTAPSDEGEDNETGIVLKPIAWKTPPASLNGFPGNGRKLEPIRPPLHNNLYSPSNLSLVSDGEESDNKFSNGHIGRLRRRPNEEDCDVVT